MLLREAQWLGERISELRDDALYPMLNIGSHTAEFRMREQPWIDKYLFARARNLNLPVVHADMRPQEGVDLVGDLTDPVFFASVAEKQFRSVCCCNLLEHVPNREEIARAVVASVIPGGYILVSGPHVFPYHPDPIDNMFRPTVAEMVALFPGTTLLRGEIVSCGTLTSYLVRKFLADPFALIRNLYQRKKQVVVQTEQGLSARQWLPWLWRTFSTVCIVLRKDAPPESS